VIHREVFSQYGPIAPWLNGLLLHIFGPQLLTIRIASAVQIFLINVMIYLVARRLDASRALAFLSSLTWAITCPVWSYQKWTFDLWPWPSITYMCLALLGTYLILRFRTINSLSATAAHLLAGIAIGLAGFCRVNYGVPFIVALFIFETLLNRRNCNISHVKAIASGIALSVGSIVVALGATRSLGQWLDQSILGPAGAFLPQFIGWKFIFTNYIQDQLFLVILVAGSYCVARKRGFIVRTLAIFAVLIASLTYFFRSKTVALKAIFFGGDTEFVDRLPGQLSSTIALRSVLVGSVIALIGLGIGAFRSRIVWSSKFSRSPNGLLPLIACCIGSVAQLYPFPDLYHLWWASPPFIILCAVGLAQGGLTVIKYGLLATLVVPTLMNTAKLREEYAISRTKWVGGVLDGMKIDNDFLPSFKSASQFLSQVSDSSQFDCTEGLWSVYSGTYMADGPDFVNWAYGAGIDESERSGQIVKCATPRDLEEGALSNLGEPTLVDNRPPLSFSKWSGWFNFYLFNRK
jgi:hypothetical protein